MPLLPVSRPSAPRRMNCCTDTVPFRHRRAPSLPASRVQGGMSEKLQNFLSTALVLNVQLRTRIARTLDLDHIGNGCGTMRQEHHTVCQQQCLVDVVSDEQDGHLRSCPHFDQQFLHVESGLCVERAEGSSMSMTRGAHASVRASCTR